MKKIFLVILTFICFSIGTEFKIINKIVTVDNPPCIVMYNCIEKYAKEYNIPKKYAYGIAYAETRYQGPKHKKYNHKKTSSSGALGPMQIILSTARYVNHDKVSRERLKNDIEYNIKTAMKLLRRLKNRYKDWELSIGAYNTGQPIINEYAEKVFAGNYKWVN